MAKGEARRRRGFEVSRRAKQIGIGAAFALALGLFFVFDLDRFLTLEWIRSQKDVAEATYSRHPVLFFTAFTAAFGTWVLFALPGTWILMIAAGTIFGLALGALATSLAYSLGGTSQFLVARYLFQDYVQRRWGHSLEKLNREMERDGLFILLSMRLMPVIPYVTINVTMSLTPIKTTSFLLVSLGATYVTGLIYANAGTQIAEIQSVADVVSPSLLASLAVLGASPLLLKGILALAKSRCPGRESSR